MRRIPVSCSILTPRLSGWGQRRLAVAMVCLAIGGTVLALAALFPLLAAPLIACALCLGRWTMLNLPAETRRRHVANDNDRFSLSSSIRPVLTPIASSRDHRTGETA